MIYKEKERQSMNFWQNYNNPLYLYPESTGQLQIGESQEPNLNATIVQKIAEGLGLAFVNEHVPVETRHALSLPPQSPPPQTTFAPINILDYIYAIFTHQRTERNTKNF